MNEIAIKGDAEIVTLSESEAREITSRINAQLESVWDLVKVAYARRAWVALGYTSWDAYCAAEFTGSRIRIPREERQEVVVSLREAGMSIRAIASAVGAGVMTVHDDLSNVQNRTLPSTITTTDGRQYPASVPKRPEPEIVEAEIVEDDPAPASQWSEDELELSERLEAGQTVVVSLRGNHRNLITWAERAGLYVRVDRRTDWGNPFEMGKDGDRETVIANYATHYLPYKPSLLSRLGELRGKALGCWCAPEPCHAHVLATRAAEEDAR